MSEGSLAAALPEVPTVDLQGLPIAQLSRLEVVEHVFTGLADRRGGWLVTLNVDHLRRFQRDPDVQRLMRGADLFVADGMPLVWAAWLQGTPLPDRVAGSDLIWLLAERAARDERSVYLLGGDPGVAESAATRLRQLWPGLRIAGSRAPRVSPRPSASELAEVRAELRDTRPDLVLVALGAPKQEFAISVLRDALPEAWWVGVGISFSFVTGDVRRAPPWMRERGLEWMHRMAQEPRRLARRYLVENVPFAAQLLIASLRRRSRKIRGANADSLR